jgi:chromosome partitioning protein
LAIILTIANQKGGVGKTTTSINLAAALSKLGRRVLLVDLDPQGNATMGSGVDKRRLTRSVYHVMIGLSDVVETRVECEGGGYSLLPANRELAGAEIELVEFEERENRLKDALHAVGDQYDFILIDSPPSLSLLTLNGLCAANGVIIPMQCEYYALEGLTDLVNTIRKVHANFNSSIRIIGILRVMFDSRITLSQQVSAQLEEHFKDKVFRSIIPRNIRLAEAPSHGMPGVNFDPSSRGAMGYVEFAAELIERMPQATSSGSTGAAQGATGASGRGATQAAAPGSVSAATATSSSAPRSGTQPRGLSSTPSPLASSANSASTAVGSTSSATSSAEVLAPTYKKSPEPTATHSATTASASLAHPQAPEHAPRATPANSSEPGSASLATGAIAPGDRLPLASHGEPQR